MTGVYTSRCRPVASRRASRPPAGVDAEASWRGNLNSSQHQDEQLRFLGASLAAISDGVVIVNARGQVVFVNKAGEQLVHHALDLQQPLAEQALDYGLRYPDGRRIPPKETPIARALAGETVIDCVVVGVTRSGADALILNSASPVRDQAGNIMGAYDIFRDVTEPQLAEAERERLLAEVQRQTLDLDAVIESTPAQLALLDREMNFVLVNSSYAEASGHDKKGLVGRNHFALFPDAENQQLFASVRDTGEPYVATEKPFAFADQPERGVTYWNWTLAPIKDGNGRVERLLLSLLDVTAQVKARQHVERLAEEARLLVSEREKHLQRLDGLVRASEEMLAQTTVQGLLQSLLESARQLIGARLGTCGYGYTNDIFRVNASFGPDGRPLVPAGTELPMSRGGVFQDLFETNAGCVRWTDEALRRHPLWWGLPEGHRPLRGLLGTRLSDIEGRARGMVILSDKEGGDFSAEDEALLCQLAALASQGLRQVEARLQAERRASELRAVLESIVEAVFVCDFQGRVTLANAAGLALLGKQNLGMEQTLFDYLQALRLCSRDGQPLALVDMALTRALGGEVVTGVEMVASHPVSGRKLDLLFSAAPLYDQAGKVVGAVEVARDVSELTELDRLKDEFIAVAAHELKTPVTVMKGYAQVLPRTMQDLKPPTRKMLEAINHGANRIDQIVGDLLDISRLQTGSLDLALERVDLSSLVESVVDRQSISSGEHEIKLKRLDRVAVQGDRDRLEQVLFNLLDNAARYSPAGGAIEVRVQLGNGVVTVSVRDHGIGVAEDKQPRIFERFYRAHTGTPFDYGGMGVGLYISREIIRRHGGNMWFQSEEGRGSTFYFSLPLGGERSE